jgi:hypothetical protein
VQNEKVRHSTRAVRSAPSSHEQATASKAKRRLVREQVDIFGRTLDDCVHLDGVTAGQGESIMVESGESDTGNAFVQRVHCN